MNESMYLNYEFETEDGAKKRIYMTRESEDGINTSEFAEDLEEFIRCAGFDVDAVINYIRPCSKCS